MSFHSPATLLVPPVPPVPPMRVGRALPESRSCAMAACANFAVPDNWTSTRLSRELRIHRYVPIHAIDSPSPRDVSTTTISLPCSAFGRTRLRSSARSRRNRSGMGLGMGKPQHVPDVAHRVDQRRIEPVDLLAQIGDVGLDDIVAPCEAVLPDVVQDLRLGQYPAGVQHQVAQQTELGGRQVQTLAGPPGFVRVLVQ